MEKDKVEQVHSKLREILIKYGNEEHGDWIVDEISTLFNFPTTWMLEDQFENYENLPEEVRECIDSYNSRRESTEIDGYENCNLLVQDLEKIGWTCEYYLDAEPFNLRKL